MNHRTLTTIYCLLVFLGSAHMKESPNTIAESIVIQDREFKTDALPRSLKLDRELGIVLAPYLEAEIIHRARDAKRGLYEIRGAITPKGDYLVMFPDGGYYGGAGKRGEGKVNDMLACRSSNKGKTWEGPTVAFDIDYN